MKQLLFAVCLIFLSPLFIYAQSNRCNCTANLQKLVEKTEENYAGYPTKVNPRTRAAYDNTVRSLRKRASGISDAKACFYLLKEYVGFFKDKHFILSYGNPEDYDKEYVRITEKAFKVELARKKEPGIEGIWINADTSLKLALRLYPGNLYKAIVLEARDKALAPGLVYFTLRPTKDGFLVKEYDSFITTAIPARKKGNLIRISSNTLYGRIYPGHLSAEEKAELETWRDNNNGLAFLRLSPKTAYLRIPTFLQNEEKIQQLVARYDTVIRTCENLIVDLSGNSGGSTGWIFFLPYFMTNPIIQHDTYLRVTKENLRYKLADLQPFAENGIPDEYKKYFPEPVLAAYKKAYKELPTTQQEFYPIPGVTFPLDSVIAKPRKIGLIVDNRCGSSAEYFFYLSKQSRKTKTYGIPTTGMMDYEGMSNLTPLPYDKYYLTIPIVKSSWTDKHPIDLTGFRPDVLLDKIDPQKWVEFVRVSLEKED